MVKDRFSQTSFLALLSARMRGDLKRAPVECLDRHAETVLSFQREPGGFAGRRGAADVYYTGLAVRALDAAGRVEQSIARNVSAYLERQKVNSVIDQLSILNGLLLVGKDGLETKDVFEFIESFRAEDGGYAKAKGGRFGSTYHTFLAVLCYDLFGEKPPDLEGLRRFLEDRTRSDGSFCESPSGKRGSTNAAAAGMSVGMLLGFCDKEQIERARNYLLGMRHDSGGWLAMKNAPLPDLLSTYTALLTLNSIGALEVEPLADAVCFAKLCERKSGGFMAGPWDDEVDVEYTYYGLGVLALAIEKGIEIP